MPAMLAGFMGAFASAITGFGVRLTLPPMFARWRWSKVLFAQGLGVFFVQHRGRPLAFRQLWLIVVGGRAAGGCLNQSLWPGLVPGIQRFLAIREKGWSPGHARHDVRTVLHRAQFSASGKHHRQWSATSTAFVRYSARASSARPRLDRSIFSIFFPP